MYLIVWLSQAILRKQSSLLSVSSQYRYPEDIPDRDPDPNANLDYFPMVAFSQPNHTNVLN